MLRRCGGTPFKTRPTQTDGARIRCLEAGNQIQQRRLAAAAGTKQGDDFATVDGEVAAFDRHHAIKAPADIDEFDLDRSRCVMAR